MTDAVSEMLAAINASDLERFVACYEAHAAIEDGDGRVLARGHAEIRDRYGPMFQKFPGLRVQARSPRWTVGPYVVQHEEVVGRDAEAEWHIAVYRVEGGLIVRELLLR